MAIFAGIGILAVVVLCVAGFAAIADALIKGREK